MKKAMGFVGFGLSIAVLVVYLMSAILAPGRDGEVLLILLCFIFPFLILGLIGVILNNKKVLSIIFTVLAGIATAFLGLMCVGVKYLLVISLPLGVIGLLFYIIHAVMVGISKN